MPEAMRSRSAEADEQPVVDEDAGALWVDSDLDAKRRCYTLVLRTSGTLPQLSQPLPQPTAERYAQQLLTAVASAEYDAAVAVQMTAVSGGDVRAAPAVVAALRADRPIPAPVVPAVTFMPGVSSVTGQAFLHLYLHGHPVGQWTPAMARSHAVHVLQGLANVDLDAAYLRYLTAVAGLDLPVATQVIRDLRTRRDAR